MTASIGYQYVVLRCVPRVDREEFVNVGVVVYSQPAGFLRMAGRLDHRRLTALHPSLDLDAVQDALDVVDLVCRGDPGGGAAADATPSARFGFLAAPRSTVVQPGPIHGGLTTDPAAQLEHLLEALVT